MYGDRRLKEMRRARLFTTLLVTAAFLVAGSILLFNRNGFMAITDMENEIEAVQSANDSLAREIDSLNHVIYLLQSDSLYMEKRVREVLGWGRENEFIIRLTEPEN
jgi:cell division protein FtsB